MINDPKDTVLSFLEATSSGRVEDAIDLIAEDCELWVTHIGTMTYDEFTNGMRSMRSKAVPGSTFKVLDIVQQDNRVAIEYRGHMPMEDGRIYGNTYHCKFIVENGRFVVIREYLDPLITSSAQL